MPLKSHSDKNEKFAAITVAYAVKTTGSKFKQRKRKKN